MTNQDRSCLLLLLELAKVLLQVEYTAIHIPNEHKLPLSAVISYWHNCTCLNGLFFKTPFVLCSNTSIKSAGKKRCSSNLIDHDSPKGIFRTHCSILLNSATPGPLSIGLGLK